MLKRRQHLAIVKNRNNQFLGVITLEDVIEEIIQQEIEDEDDEDETLEPLVWGWRLYTQILEKSGEFGSGYFAVLIGF